MSAKTAGGFAAGVVLAVTGFIPASTRADEITVFAAASMTNAITEIAARFEVSTGHEVIVSFAGSSALARQIQNGAHADIFISANPGWMDILEQDGLLEEGTRFDLVNNSIVLIAYKTDTNPVEIGPDTDLKGLLGDGYLAMALVDAVPAGIYGKAALENLGLWDDVKARAAQSDNVRTALAFVATGEAPYGIVYATDAAAEDRVTVAGFFPPDSHPPIVYPAADLANRNVPAEAEFLEYLRGPEAREVFEDQGFVVVPDRVQ